MKQWVKLRIAGLVALFIGFPLTEEVLAQSWWDIGLNSVGLTASLIDASSGS